MKLGCKLFLIGAILSTLPAVFGEDSAGKLWVAHIRPLFADHCFKCHGNIESKGGLSLMTPAEIFKGGDGGAVVVPGKPQDSPLYKRILPEGDPHMPKKGKQLPPEDLVLIKRWIELLSPTETKATFAVTPVAQESSLFHRTHWQPPSGTSPAQAIDLQIEKRWKELNIAPGEICDDRTFVRRVYLDLAGRIPTPDEMSRFFSDNSTGKRALLVTALLESADYAQRMRDVFDVVFMERGSFQSNRDRRRNPGNARLHEKWLEYLETSFRENRPWNVMAKEIVVARPSDPKVKSPSEGAAEFLYARKDNVQQMAEATGSAFMGLQIKCAQCHDHPVAPEIKQAHYWGIVAAFNRSKGVDTPAGSGVAESAIGGFIKFTNLKGTSTEARMTFLDGKSLNEVWPKEGAKETEMAEQYANATLMGDGKSLKGIPVPKYSRREQFANWLTDQNNPLLARTFVNRVWELLLGRGIVHPVDRMDSSRAASHPELLDWLAEDFATNGYDVKRLIRIITASRAYQLDSHLPGKIRPADNAFAYALDKPVTAEVLAKSMIVAVSGNEPVAGVDAAQLRRQFADAFPDVFATENVATLKQALFLSNNPAVAQLIKTAGAKMLAQLATLDESTKVRVLFSRTLGRAPDAEELKQSVEFLRAHVKDAEAGTRELLWALLTGAEFRINH